MLAAQPEVSAFHLQSDPLAALIQRCRSGDQAAYTELYKEVHPCLLRFARKFCDPELAQDVAQEAFITVLRRLDRYGGRAAFKTWLFRVTANQAIDMMRRQQRQHPYGLSPDRLGGRQWAPAPDEAAEASSRRSAVQSALRSLHPDYRTVLYLHYYADLPLDQVAACMGCPLGTVKSRLYRGRRALGRALAGAGYPALAGRSSGEYRG